LRSLGRVNAGALAQKFGGGGHFNAAGFTLNEGLAQIKERLIAESAAFMPDNDADG
jgi:nanoRNase/pAp phosphatase (c-di-AMP/oligoRNAs hydrolase)